MRVLLISVALVLAFGNPTAAKTPMRLVSNPSLSPDGSTIAFAWNGDLWSVPSTGGTAKQLTLHPSRDAQPMFSPDGSELAFISNREGNSPQVFVMPATGGTPKQISFHTEGYALNCWTGDGKKLLVTAVRDHFWRHGERFFLLDRHERKAETLLFDDYGSVGRLSPDGSKLLFVREGAPWWRKGYTGSQAGQIWLYDCFEKKFDLLIQDAYESLWPLWKATGDGFYFVSGRGGNFNLWEFDLRSKKRKQLTHFADDNVVFPDISRDGSTIVFRHLFDLYVYRPGKDDQPRKIDIVRDDDRPIERTQRRTLTTAGEAAFTADGLEIAMIAGGDLWVMDTELREPQRVTATTGEESEPIFTRDGNAILFLADNGTTVDIMKATRTDAKSFWWQNEKFQVEPITTDGLPKSNLTISPDGKKIAFVRKADLWISDIDGGNAKKILSSWNAPAYDWSPDGKWLVYSISDNDFNSDVFLLPLDGSRPAYNLSRHPFLEGNPVWSPDGKTIAFISRKGFGEAGETEIAYVFLREEDDEVTARERKLQKALDKMKLRTLGSGSSSFGKRDLPMGTPVPPNNEDEFEEEDAEQVPQPRKIEKLTKEPTIEYTEPKKTEVKKDAAPIVIDFERLAERVKRIRLGRDGAATALFWSPDGKKLAFTGRSGGSAGTFTIDLTEDAPAPKSLSSSTGNNPRWLKTNSIVWLANGVPASMPVSATARPTTTAVTPSLPSALLGRIGTRSGGSTVAPDSGEGTSYRFSVVQEIDLSAKRQMAFDLAWRTMRDRWYDPALGNRDWNRVRAKFTAMAAEVPDSDGLATVVNMMLGELNGSHLGFYPTGAIPSRLLPPGTPEPETAPSDVTAHLGIRFVDSFAGPGLKVRDTILGGPADTKKTRLLPGEVITAIDGKKLAAGQDATELLNGSLNRDIKLTVQDAQGKEREVVIRPTTFARIRRLLYECWIKANRAAVEKLSQGTLGYLHISAMNESSFVRFQEELYSAGAGKDGLVIDVRENGGGSTADHLLTALTQPVHAIAVPRDGGPGYPQDRKVYITWNKPIIVLCNQNSFSNAEIFSHAIKTLKRGRLVGVPTAGGVISTGATQIMDVGMLRLPFRGWYLLNGQDMERNGAVPDHIVWPAPGELPAGTDSQLTKAVELLLAEVEAWKERPQPKLIPATKRVDGMRAGQ